MNHFKRKFKKLFDDYKTELVEREKVIEILQGWLAYAFHADTYKYREKITKIFDELFPENRQQNRVKIIDKKKYNYIKEEEYQKIKSSHDKTFYLLKKKLTIKEITVLRMVSEGTIWDHIAELIENKKISAFDVVSRNKIFRIVSKIKSEKNTLKEIKQRLNSISISYHEINCVFAMIKSKKN